MACSQGYDFRYKVKLDDGAEIKPQIPFLNGRIYDTKFESQFYMISNSNKVLRNLISFMLLKMRIGKGVLFVVSDTISQASCSFIFMFIHSDYSEYIQVEMPIQTLQNSPKENTVYNYM